MLTRYVQAAMTHARIDWLPDSKVYYGEIPELQGVWATGETDDDCRAELREVLEDWITVSLTRGHPLLVIDGLDLHVELVG